MWQIESCYAGDGDLSAALLEAAEIVRRIGAVHVAHVIARMDEIGAWWVDVVYRA